MNGRESKAKSGRSRVPKGVPRHAKLTSSDLDVPGPNAHLLPSPAVKSTSPTIPGPAKRGQALGTLSTKKRVAKKRKAKKVRFAPGPLRAPAGGPDGHPTGEGRLAKAVRVIDGGPARGFTVTKKDVRELDLPELLGNDQYEHSLTKLKIRVGLLPAMVPSRPFVSQPKPSRGRRASPATRSPTADPADASAAAGGPVADAAAAHASAGVGEGSHNLRALAAGAGAPPRMTAGVAPDSLDGSAPGRRLRNRASPKGLGSAGSPAPGEAAKGLTPAVMVAAGAAPGRSRSGGGLVAGAAALGDGKHAGHSAQHWGMQHAAPPQTAAAAVTAAAATAHAACGPVVGPAAAGRDQQDGAAKEHRAGKRQRTGDVGQAEEQLPVAVPGPAEAVLRECGREGGAATGRGGRRGSRRQQGRDLPDVVDRRMQEQAAMCGGLAAAGQSGGGDGPAEPPARVGSKRGQPYTDPTQGRGQAAAMTRGAPPPVAASTPAEAAAMVPGCDASEGDAAAGRGCRRRRQCRDPTKQHGEAEEALSGPTGAGSGPDGDAGDNIDALAGAAARARPRRGRSQQEAAAAPAPPEADVGKCGDSQGAAARGRGRNVHTSQQGAPVLADEVARCASGQRDGGGEGGGGNGRPRRRKPSGEDPAPANAVEGVPLPPAGAAGAATRRHGRGEDAAAATGPAGLVTGDHGEGGGVALAEGRCGKRRRSGDGPVQQRRAWLGGPPGPDPGPTGGGGADQDGGEGDGSAAWGRGRRARGNSGHGSQQTTTAAEPGQEAAGAAGRSGLGTAAVESDAGPDGPSGRGTRAAAAAGRRAGGGTLRCSEDGGQPSGPSTAQPPGARQRGPVGRVAGRDARAEGSEGTRGGGSQRVKRQGKGTV